MTKEESWKGKNVDLTKLTEEIEKFFKEDGFNQVQSFAEGTYFQIQARKTGVMRTLTSSRKAIQIIIRGTPDNFHVSLSSGEWGKNVTSAVLFNPAVSLMGMTMNASFSNKVWRYVHESVMTLENSYVKPLESTPKGEDPTQILKRRLALGEITKQQYDELSGVVGTSDTAEETTEEPKPKNFARIITDAEE